MARRSRSAGTSRSVEATAATRIRRVRLVRDSRPPHSCHSARAHGTAAGLRVSAAHSFLHLDRLVGCLGPRRLTLDESHRYLALRSPSIPAARRLYSPQLQEVHRLADTERTAVLDTPLRATPGSSLRRMRTLRHQDVPGRVPHAEARCQHDGPRSEARAPLLDHEPSVRAQLPDAWILANGSRKKLLRTVLYRYVPSHLVESRKRGFDPPLAAWFSRHLRPRIEALSASNALRETGGSSLKASARWPGSIYVASVTTACGCTTS